VSATTWGCSSVVLADAVVPECTVVVLAGLGVFVGLVTGSAVLAVGLGSFDRFFVVGGVGSVVGSGFFVAVAVDVGLGSADGSAVVFIDESAVVESVDESVDDELVDDDSVPDESDVSAHATPWPATTAAPMPNATASPPIRPTYAPAPMGEVHTLRNRRPYASSANRRR
jgi:hypothetical protein